MRSVSQLSCIVLSGGLLFTVACYSRPSLAAASSSQGSSRKEERGVLCALASEVGMLHGLQCPLRFAVKKAEGGEKNTCSQKFLFFFFPPST